MVNRDNSSVEFIYCSCGCQKTTSKYIYQKGKPNKKRIKKYIHGHGGHEKVRHRFINTQGYILIYKPEHHYADNLGYVREHRLVYEKYYKCSLLPWGDIHHKNIHNLSESENKLDNSKENLEGMMHYKHLQLHIDESRIKKDMLQRKCSKCGSNVTRMRQHGKGQRLGYEWYRNPFNKLEWWCFTCYNRYKALIYYNKQKSQ